MIRFRSLTNELQRPGRNVLEPLPANGRSWSARS
jgi:hypothetical protein